jgi:putative tryptophan/tyrosine transport system substrate-binding protein
MNARRDFLGLAGACVTAAAFAQARTKVHRVGFLEAGAASANGHFLAAFRDGMREQGYVEGRNLVIDVRWAEGRADRFPTLLREIMGLQPDVIVVASTLGALSAHEIVKTVPVVFVGVSDPLQMGIVNSLAHPGGNLTGLSRHFGEGLLGKALQILLAVAPGVTRVGILSNVDGEVAVRVREAEAGARAQNVVPLPVTVRDERDFAGAFAALRRERANGLMVIADPLTLRHRDVIIRLAAVDRLPAVYEFGEFARAGGLVSYSASISALFVRAAAYVGKILTGTRPGDIPVEQPSTFELVVNMRTARALKLTVPQSLLGWADEVIQ